MTEKQKNIILFASGLLISLIFIVFNEEIFIAINSAGNTSLWNLIWAILTQFGDGFFVSLVVVLLVRKYPVFTANAFIALLLSLIFTQGGKEIFGGPRPVSYFGEQMVNVIGPRLGYRSFPSGHSATIFLLCWLLWKNKVLPRIGVGWVLIGAIIAVSRVAVGAHFPVDIAGGAWLGVLAGWLGNKITGKFPHYARFWHFKMVQISFSTVSIFSIPFMFINFRPAKYFPEFYIIFALFVLFAAGYNLLEILKNSSRISNP